MALGAHHGHRIRLRFSEGNELYNYMTKENPNRTKNGQRRIKKTFLVVLRVLPTFPFERARQRRVMSPSMKNS
jgi:hypothetical protein